MSDPIIPLAQIEEIKSHAREAAKSGEGPDTCPYIRGSIYEEKWKDAFYANVPTPSVELAA
jgi:hypothetical protein